MRIGIAAAVLAFAAFGVRARHHHARSEGEAGMFDYYVLSLSWAPTYCLTHPGDGAECSGRGYGFVLHGLWPQYDTGGYPEHCPSQLTLSAEAISKGRTLYPSERLMLHEWEAHGTCTGLDPLSYMGAADRATAAVRIPKTLEVPQHGQSLTPAQIVGLFRGSNPQMPGDAITVACSRGGLSEVRVCLTKTLALQACGRGVRTTCPSAPIELPASR